MLPMSQYDSSSGVNNLPYNHQSLIHLLFAIVRKPASCRLTYFDHSLQNKIKCNIGSSPLDLQYHVIFTIKSSHSTVAAVTFTTNVAIRR